MRISDSAVTMSSAGREEALEVNLRAKTQETTGSVRVIPMGFSVVDRVSLSEDYTHQSDYSATLDANSAVRTEDGTQISVFSQKEAVEKIVGAVINREVVVGKLENNQDINDGPAAGTGTSGNGFTGASGESLVTISSVDIRYESQQAAFSSAGQVHTEDGRVIDFSLELSLDRASLTRVESTTEIHSSQVSASLTDPLVVNLEGGIPSLSDTSFEFDINGDGDAEELAFAGRGSGFLAFDRNGDMTINNGSELFGPGTGNGFGELAALDDDANGWIDENDAVFSKLSVWTRNEDGTDRLISLKDAGIGAINLNSATTTMDIADAGNSLSGRLRQTGMFLFENGKAGLIQQIDLADKAKVPSQAAAPSADLSDPGSWRIASRGAGGKPGGNQGIFGLPKSLAIPGQLLTPDNVPVEENPLKSLLEELEAIKAELKKFFEDHMDYKRDHHRRPRIEARSLTGYQLNRLNHHNNWRV